MSVQPETTNGVPTSPYCRELRSKQFFYLQSMPTEDAHLLDASGACWCRRTMQAFGPDGERAIPQECKPGRHCYHSLFAEKSGKL